MDEGIKDNSGTWAHEKLKKAHKMKSEYIQKIKEHKDTIFYETKNLHNLIKNFEEKIHVIDESIWALEIQCRRIEKKEK